jgi:hypothetical protein
LLLFASAGGPAKKLISSLTPWSGATRNGSMTISQHPSGLGCSSHEPSRASRARRFGLSVTLAALVRPGGGSARLRHVTRCLCHDFCEASDHRLSDSGALAAPGR